jgi:outer membrane protein
MTTRSRLTVVATAMVPIFAILVPFVHAARAVDLSMGPPAPPIVAASEASPRWFVRLGALGVLNQSSSKLYAQPVVGVVAPGIGFVPIQGAGPQELLIGRGAVYSNLITANIQAGYFFTPTWSLEISGGVPVWETVKITGSSATTPSAGTVLSRVLPGAPPVTAVYHFTGLGAFQPYAGGGIAPTFAFTVRDGFNTGGSIGPSLGLVLQGGVDYMVNRNWGVFIDVKKMFAQSDGRATGINLGPPVGTIPAAASIKTNAQPWLCAMGLTYRF